MSKKTIHESSAKRVREMIELYKSGRTQKEIGKRFGVTKQYVSLLFKRAGFKPRGKNKSPGGRKPKRAKYPIIDKELLIKYYIEERLPVRKMMPVFNLNRYAVQKSLKHHKIPMRTPRQYRLTILTRELLEDLYLKKKMTAREIAAFLRYSLGRIRQRLSELQIKKPMKLRRFQNKIAADE